MWQDEHEEYVKNEKRDDRKKKPMIKPDIYARVKGPFQKLVKIQPKKKSCEEVI